eukprot:6108548-Pleurochrysis_carterae.AAC.2
MPILQFRACSQAPLSLRESTRGARGPDGLAVDCACTKVEAKPDTPTFQHVVTADSHPLSETEESVKRVDAARRSPLGEIVAMPTRSVSRLQNLFRSSMLFRNWVSSGFELTTTSCEYDATGIRSCRSTRAAGTSAMRPSNRICAYMWLFHAVVPEWCEATKRQRCCGDGFQLAFLCAIHKGALQ